MSDVHCAVCSEPWDAYGVQHGDMELWEGDLFRQGSGCPSCAGHASKQDRDKAIEQHLRDRVLDTAWDDDVDPVGDALRAPPWRRPADLTLWWCSCCRGTWRTSSDDGKPYWMAPGGTHYGGRFGVGEEPAFRHTQSEQIEQVDGKMAPVDVEYHYCDRCAMVCDRCNETWITRCGELEGDSYDVIGGLGQSFPEDSGIRSICVGCLETQCSECELQPDECVCVPEDER